MPRIRQKEDEYRDADFKRAVRAQLGYRLLSQTDLADSVGISKSSMSKLLDEPGKITVDRLRKMIDALGLAPEDVLKLLGYSNKKIKEVQ